MNRHNKFISLLLAASVLVCCTAGGLDPAVTGGEMVDYGFYMNGTKAGGGSAGSTTYRAMLYNYGTPGQYQYANNSGTYRDMASGDYKSWLIPCYVNTTSGAWTADNHAAGLRAMRGRYYISFVSPAVAPVQYSGSEWGLPMYRDSSATHPNLYISSPALMDTLRGNHLNNQAIYDVPDSVKLRQMKSKIEVVIENATSSAITVGEIGMYIHDSCYFKLSQNIIDFASFSKPYHVIYSGSSTQLASKSSRTVRQDYILFSYDYSKSSASSFAPSLEVRINDKAPMTLSIAKNFDPMKYYTCKVKVNENSLSLTLTVVRDDWTNSGNNHNGGNNAHVE